MLILGYIWHTNIELFDFKEELGPYIEYPEYMFKIVASVLYGLSKVFITLIGQNIKIKVIRNKFS